jgi:transcriptional regulator with XRE-family HTH domain
LSNRRRTAGHSDRTEGGETTVGLDTGRDDATPGAAALRARVAATVRDLRTSAGRSLADVSAAAGIGKSTLHAIEAGEANPGIETLWALARALGVPFGQLLDPPAPTVRVVRAGEAPRVASEVGAFQAHLLASSGHAARVELYTLELEPGPVRDADAHMAGTVEHILVTAGALRTGPIDATVTLATGDLVTFPGDVAHRYEALEGATSAVLLLEYT